MRRVSTVDGLLLATVVIWAFNITVTRYVLTHGWRPLAYASLRYAGATLIFVAITVASGSGAAWTTSPRMKRIRSSAMARAVW